MESKYRRRRDVTEACVSACQRQPRRTHEKTVPNMPSRSSSRTFGSSFLARSIAPAWSQLVHQVDLGKVVVTTE